ncbi:hypothetical protein [Thermococcus sp. MAR1]|uniref:hypothetical protein n=1 Tax=Thermococcus sp. MAR1 TaxID=1638263 RepID=UPI00143A7AA4|nr:hypothetical protein [Thermococcus sp. MAR1]NJE09327.1 hypothetical protein [Thermococcus sp. MAR1]
MPMKREAFVGFLLLLCARYGSDWASASVEHPTARVNFVFDHEGRIAALQLLFEGVEPGAATVVRLLNSEGAVLFETTVVVENTVVVTELPEQIPTTELDKVTVVVAT